MARLIIQSEALMKEEIFLALCDDHNSIIHEYGCDISCNRTAAICLRGCSEYQHKQKSNKHEFMPARELYSLVGQIRQSYKMFEKDFKEVYLKSYIQNIKAAIDQFETKMNEKFSSEHALAQIFGRNTDERIQFMIEQKQDEIEFAEIKCKEVFQLRQFATFLYKGFKQEQERRTIKILTKQLEDHLRGHKLIPQLAKTPEKIANQQIIIEANRLSDHASIIHHRLNSYRQQEKNINEIVFKLNQNLNDYKDDRQFPTFVAGFVDAARELIIQLNPSQITVAVKGQITLGPFWSSLLDLVQSQKIPNLKIISTQKSQQANMDQLRIKAVRQKIPLRIVQADWLKNPEVLHEQT